ncbi:MAG: transposase, partial [Nitrosopumilaceae archaeon]|nr:transposase [Nitrosopumilaceae archaeon]
MGRQETRFLKRVAEGVGRQVGDGTGSGGPGRSYRKGITLADLFKLFLNDEAAREWFEATVWPDGPACPRCSSVECARPSTHLAMPYWCARCKRHFSVKVGTVM